MLKRLLIANRGEIAVRIARTARALGIETVAVFSEADRDALHVSCCDYAACIGPATAADSYLNIASILTVARGFGADALHPGYGFLAENADFCQACDDAGVVFVGPSVSAMRAMGSKIEAKRIAERAGVPVIPGYAASQDDAALLDAAEQIGFPVLIKAAAGGGGRGMRVVNAAGEFGDALASARREAKSAFADATVLLERYVAAPRHIEVQVFADRHGTAVHLFERDCSVQRRHQKVIEEAPAFGLTEPLRQRLYDAALRIVGAVQYVGAGTVEFLVAGDDFYFMEMNTRLQVEHPVTEAITNLDLVEWQLRVAAGEALPLAQAAITRRGHAIEVRLCAERPNDDFLPSTGRITDWHVPTDSSTRVDAGFRSGDEISPHYDSLLAKCIAWAEDRAQSRVALLRHLDGCRVHGVQTNRDFLRRLLRHPVFAAADGRFTLNTGFVGEHGAAFQDRAADWHALAVLAVCTPAAISGDESNQSPNRPHAGSPTPWQRSDGFRVNAVPQTLMRVWLGEQAADVERNGNSVFIRMGADVSRYEVSNERWLADGTKSLHVAGKGELRGKVWRASGVVRSQGTVAALVISDDARAIDDGGAIYIDDGDALRVLRRVDEHTRASASEITGSQQIHSPLPGNVLQVLVAPQQTVRAKQPLLVLEAMKMEHTLVAGMAGVVAEVRCAAGDKVKEGQLLMSLQAGDPS